MLLERCDVYPEENTGAKKEKIGILNEIIKRKERKKAWGYCRIH